MAADVTGAAGNEHWDFVHGAALPKLDGHCQHHE
jgi:hypothetical protein